MTDVAIPKMLSDFGVTHPEAVRSAVEALVEAGVLSSRPNRTRIAADKRERVAAVISDAFLRHCNNGNCRQQSTELAGSRRHRSYPTSGTAKSAVAPPTAARLSGWRSP